MSHKTVPFRAPVLCGNRSSGVQPISVNRVFVSWYDRELIALGMSHRTAPSEPLFSVGTGAQPLSANRELSTVFMRQSGSQPAIDPELY